MEQALGVTRRFIRHTCYTRGITRYYVLRRAGFDLSLVFGIERNTASRYGHCWIVLDGNVYLEPNDPTERFVRVVIVQFVGSPISLFRIEVPMIRLRSVQMYES